jgi:dCMP deaminase
MLTEKYIEYYMRIAEETAKLSSARRLKVGTVIVKNNQTISTGYNGTFPGFDNNCEEEIWEGTRIPLNLDGEEFDYVPVLKTHDEVYHSEANAIYKLAKSTESAEGAAMVTTHACCKPCAMAIAMSGIKEFYFKHEYRDMGGVDFLQRAGVRVFKCEES